MSIKQKIVAIGKWSAACAGALILFLGILLGLMQTEIGKRQIVRLVATEISKTSDWTVGIGRLEGFFPFRFGLDRLTIHDQYGEWLHIENASLRWAPVQLLRGRFSFNEIEAGLIRLKRSPSSRQERAKPERVTPAWNLSIPSLTIERMAVGRLEMGEGITGSSIQGRLALRGRPSGPLKQPEAILSISLRDFNLDDLHASRMDCELRLRALGRMAAPFPGLEVRGKGHVAGIALRGKGIKTTEDPFSWTISADLPAERPITINSFEATDKNLLLRVSGGLDPSDLSFHAETALEIQDLGPFSEISGFSIRGKHRMHATVEGDGRSRSLSALIEGRLNASLPIPPSLATLIGPEITYGGRVQISQFRHVSISEMRIDTAALHLSGEASIDSLTKETMGSVHITVPRLASLSEARGMKLEGPLEIDVGVGGTFLDPDLTVKGAGNGIVLMNIPFQRAAMGVRAKGLLRSPRGDFKLRLSQENQTLEAAGGFALDRNHLMLSGFALTAPGTHITGDLDLDIDSLTGQGSVQGRSEDLSLLASLLGEKIGGNLGIEASFSRGLRGQDIRLGVRGRELVSPFGKAGEFRLTAHLEDVFRSIEGRSEIEMRSFQSGDLDLEKLTLRAKGEAGSAAFSGEASGRYRESFEVHTTGLVARSSEGSLLRIDLLEGRIGEYPLGMQRPLIIRQMSRGYSVEEAALTLGKAVLQASGQVGREVLSLNVRLEAMPMEMLRLIGYPALKGSAGGSIRLSGPLKQPEAILSISLRDFNLDDLHASRMDCELRLKALGRMAAPFPGLEARGKGHVAGIALRGKGIKTTEDPFSWTISADLPAERPITINSFEATDKNLLLRFSGELDPSDLSFHAETALEIQDLSPFSEISGFSIRGKHRMHATVEGDGRSRSLSARIDGRLDASLPIPPSLATLIGPEITYGGRVQISQFRHVSISDIRIDTAALRLSGEASIDALTKETMGRMHIKVPRLASLSEARGVQLEGPLEIDVGVGGTFLDPDVTVKGAGNGIVLLNIPFQRAVMGVRAKGLLRSPRGNFEFRLSQKDQTLQAAGGFALDRKHLMLSGLALTAPGTHITGDLDLDLDGLTGQGSIRGRSEDLSLLASLLGEKIGGSLGIEASFSKGLRGQDIRLGVRGRELVSPFGRAAEFRLTAHLEDVLRSLKGRSKIEIRSFQSGDLDLQKLTLRARGEPGSVVFSGKASGRYHESFEVHTRGLVARSSEGSLLRVDLLEGRIGEYPLGMQRPLIVRQISRGFSVEEAALTLGEAVLQASGQVGREVLGLDVRLEAMPMEMLLLIGYPALEGSAGGRIRLSGRPDLPEADITLRIQEIRLRDESFHEIPPANLAADISFKGGTVRGDISVEGLSEKRFEANFEIPLKISFSPPAFSLEPQGALKGQISAEVDLTPIPSYLDLEGQVMKGRIIADLKAAGTVDSPEIKGGLRIVDGVYENTRTATIIRDVHIDTRIVEKRLNLERFHATDGEKGTITARGWIDLLPDRGFPFQFDLAVDNCQLMKSDDLTATTNGRLTFSGSTQKGTLAGSLIISPAEIQIPDRLPPEIQDLEVVEINIPEGRRPQEQGARTKGESRWNLDLRLKAPGRVFVRGRGLDTEWKGELHLTGNTKEPSIKGVLSVVRGNYNFFGRRLILTEGTLTFTDSQPPSPLIDVIAENRRSEMNARIRLTGTTSDFKIKVESEPPMPSDEVLSRLLFGQSVSNISPIQALRLAEAINSLAGGDGAGLDILDRTRRFVRMDHLDVKQVEGENGVESSVSIGKYLSDKVYLELEQGVGTEEGKATIDIELTPNISVESDIGTDAHKGIGLNWKWDY